MFQFATRNDSESDAEKISHSILSDIVSTLVDKAEKASSQRHHASADRKTFESVKLNHPWLIVLQGNNEVRLKCSTCSEAKINSIWAHGRSGYV